MKVSRRVFLASGAGLSLSAIAAGLQMRLVEPENLEATEKTIPLSRLRKPLKALHLSDFHASPDVSYETIEAAVDQSLAMNPDLALLTGDYITSELLDPAEYQRILTKLSARMPTFACIGNHDGGRWAARTYGYPNFDKVADLLRTSGIEFLFNQKMEVHVRGERLTIVGLGDLWSEDCKPGQVLKAKRDTENPLLVLSHNPDSKSLLQKLDWDVLFCGHTHGGQLVIPLVDYRPFLPVKDKSFPEGLRQFDSKYVHITRGVGNLHGLRINCRPEISLLHLLPKSRPEPTFRSS